MPHELDFGIGGLEFTQFRRRQADGGGSEKIIKMRRVCRTGYGSDPGSLGQQPCEGELGHGAVFARSPFANQVRQRNVVFQGFRRELGQGGKPPRGEPAVFIDGPGKESASQRAVRHKADAEFPQGGKNFGFRHNREYSL